MMKKKILVIIIAIASGVVLSIIIAIFAIPPGVIPDFWQHILGKF